MEKTALQEFNPQRSNLISLESETTVETIKNSICKGASNEQLMTFLSLARHYNLNPFNKEIYFSSHIGIHVGRHGLLRIANRHPQFKGLKSCPIREKDDFQVDFATGKIVKHITGKGNGRVVGAWAMALRADAETMPVICYVDEFAKNNPAWKDYTQDMISYKAEVRALRNAFNSEYEGITIIDPDEEMKEELRPTFAESYSPAVGALTMDDYLGDDKQPESPLKTDQSKLVNDKQIARLFARAKELKLSQKQVKDMLIEKKYIDIDPEKNDYSTKTMKAVNYEAAYEGLNDLARQVNQTDKQKTMDIENTNYLN